MAKGIEKIDDGFRRVSFFRLKKLKPMCPELRMYKTSYKKSSEKRRIKKIFFWGDGKRKERKKAVPAGRRNKENKG